MKQTLPHHRSTARAGSTAALALVASLALPLTALAKPGKGNGGGDDGGGGYDESGDEAPVEEVAAPITYATTEVLWHDAVQFNDEDFQGINVDDVNSLGIAVGFAKLAPSPGETYGERRAGITAMVRLTSSGYELVLDDVSGYPIPTNQLFDLNLLLEDEIDVLNASLGGQPWRIAYAREINEAGQVACQLLPVDEPRIWGSLNTSGKVPTPVLMAVADLAEGTLVAVEPDYASPDQDFNELTELGDILLRDLDPVSGVEFNRLLLLEGDSYEPEMFPSVDDFWPSMNSSREITLEAVTSTGGVSLRRYSVNNLSETLLWERESGGQFGLAEDGSAYAARELTVTTGKGRNRVTTTYVVPYHIEELTDGTIRRTPLITPDLQGSFLNIVNNPSPASMSGEEEFLITLQPAPASYQIYKPNFGARFTLVDIPAGAAQFIRLSPPFLAGSVSDDHQTSDGDYHGGYIAWFDTNFFDTKAYILTPDGAPMPEVVTAP